MQKSIRRPLVVESVILPFLPQAVAPVEKDNSVSVQEEKRAAFFDDVFSRRYGWKREKGLGVMR